MKPKFFIPALASLVIAFAIFVSCSEYESNVLDSGLDSGSAAYLGGFIVNPCGDVTTVPLCAGQNDSIGYITVANDEDSICVTYTITNTDWSIVETHLAFGMSLEGDDFPQTRSGNPKVGKFPHGDTFVDPEVWEAEYCFYLGTFGYEAYDIIYIAAHAAVQTVGEQEETAWGDGCEGTSFPGNNWATYFVHMVQYCSTIPPGCDSGLEGQYRTETQGGWGTVCLGNSPGCYLQNNFIPPFSGGLVVGNCCPTDSVTFTTADAIEAALPTCGEPDILDGSWMDPVCNEDPECQVTNAGVLLGQVVALTLNVVFDLNSSFITHGDIFLRDLVVCGVSMDSPFYGMTVQEVLNEANKVLGGCSTTDPYAISEIVSSINQNFVGGTMDACFLCLPCDEWIVYGSKRGSGVDPSNDPTTGDIYEIDLNTMTATLLYHPGISTGTQNWPNGNAYDPDNQRFYFTTNPGQLHFYELDATVHEYAGPIIGAVACGSFYEGKYYYIQEGTDDLHAVSFNDDGFILTDDILTDITNNESKFAFGDIAISSDGLLYGSGSRSLEGTSPPPACSEFYTIDLIGSSPSYSYNVIGNAVGQIAFGSDGVLYAHSAGAGTFYTVNLETGALTYKGCTMSGCLLLTDLASGPLCSYNPME